MKVVIITAAGISSRFNEGVSEKERCLKIIYYEENKENTLLYHLLEKCRFADRIVLVGGYKYDDLKAYCDELPGFMKDKLILAYNEHYADLASGYSLYVGLKIIFDCLKDVEEVLFSEGDLDIDKASFYRIIDSKKNVLTYSFEPIYARKAVALYQDGQGHFHYIFNHNHGLLKIDEEFSLIFNSGQIWKFTDIGALKTAGEKFYQIKKEETNLYIIQNYIDLCDTESFELIPLLKWTNCNTREDYRNLLSNWKEDAG